jgi:hypothetical protein
MQWNYFEYTPQSCFAALFNRAYCYATLYSGKLWSAPPPPKRIAYPSYFIVKIGSGTDKFKLRMLQYNFELKLIVAKWFLFLVAFFEPEVFGIRHEQQFYLVLTARSRCRMLWLSRYVGFLRLRTMSAGWWLCLRHNLIWSISQKVPPPKTRVSGGVISRPMVWRVDNRVRTFMMLIKKRDPPPVISLEAITRRFQKLERLLTSLLFAERNADVP